MEIFFSRTALKALRKSGKAALLMEKIEALADDPASMTANVRKLVGRPESRLRVQDMRVIFRIEGEKLFVDDIGARWSIY